MPGGNVARSEMMRYSAGMDMISSHNRMMTVSVRPPKYPEIPPIIMPKVNDSRMPMMPMESEICEP